jgi:hypothetical protein
LSSRDVCENEDIEKIAKSVIIIKSQSIKNALLTALADEEMVKIMNCVMDQSKSLTILQQRIEIFRIRRLLEKPNRFLTTDLL